MNEKRTCPLCKGAGKVKATRDEIIVHMYNQGEPYIQIAYAIGIKSPSTISYHIKRLKNAQKEPEEES